jgi:hypothetical protein
MGGPSARDPFLSQLVDMSDSPYLKTLRSQEKASGLEGHYYFCDSGSTEVEMRRIVQSRRERELAIQTSFVARAIAL